MALLLAHWAPVSPGIKYAMKYATCSLYSAATLSASPCTNPSWSNFYPVDNTIWSCSMLIFFIMIHIQSTWLELTVFRAQTTCRPHTIGKELRLVNRALTASLSQFK